MLLRMKTVQPAETISTTRQYQLVVLPRNFGTAGEFLIYVDELRSVCLQECNLSTFVMCKQLADVSKHSVPI